MTAPSACGQWPFIERARIQSRTYSRIMGQVYRGTRNSGDTWSPLCRNARFSYPSASITVFWCPTSPSELPFSSSSKTWDTSFCFNQLWPKFDLISNRFHYIQISLWTKIAGSELWRDFYSFRAVQALGLSNIKPYLGKLCCRFLHLLM